MPKTKTQTSLEHFEGQGSYAASFGMTPEAYSDLINAMVRHMFTRAWGSEDEHTKTQEVMEFLAQHPEAFPHPLATPNDWFLFGMAAHTALETVDHILDSAPCPHCHRYHGPEEEL